MEKIVILKIWLMELMKVVKQILKIKFNIIYIKKDRLLNFSKLFSFYDILNCK